MTAQQIIPFYKTIKIPVCLPIQKQQSVLQTNSPVQVYISLSEFQQGLRLIWKISCGNIAIPISYKLMCGIGISNCKIIRHGTYDLSTLDNKAKGTDISHAEIKVYAVKTKLLCEFTIRIFKTSKHKINHDQIIYAIEPDYHTEYLHVCSRDRLKLSHYTDNWLFNRYLFHDWMCKFKVLMS